MFQTSVLYEKCLDFLESADMIQVHQGGTSSGKTYSILQALFTIACKDPKQIITVVGQDIPNLKAGALRDAQTIMNSSAALKSLIVSYNKSDRIFEFTNGSIMEFKSYDDAQDAKSGKRDYLFINEANGISQPVYTELALRTRVKVFMDYNPNSEFWVHEHLIGKPGVQLVISDHRHNPFLTPEIRSKIESIRQVDEQLWKVYARGLTGRITGLVFQQWYLTSAIPEGAKQIAVGLDFGFTNDPTGCLAVYKHNGELWVDELIYERGLTNPDISARLKDAGVHKYAEIIADSAEPKSIEELRRMGWNIMPSQKGPDSILNGIDILRRWKINVTNRSANLRKELLSYKWKVGASGSPVNLPIDAFNHLIDPLRYVALNKLKISNLGKRKTVLPFTGSGVIPSDFDYVK